MDSLKLIISSRVFEQYIHFKNGNIDYMFFRDEKLKHVHLLCVGDGKGRIAMGHRWVGVAEFMRHVMTKNIKRVTNGCIYVIASDIGGIQSTTIDDTRIIPMSNSSRELDIFCSAIFESPNYMMEVAEVDSHLLAICY